MMEDTKLYRGIAPCLQDFLIMGDGLPVLPNLIHHVLKRIIQVRCVVFGLFRHWVSMISVYINSKPKSIGTLMS